MNIDEKAERARALLSDALLTEAIERIRQGAIDDLTGCDPKNVEGLQYARLRLGVADEVLAQLRRHIETQAMRSRHRE